MCTLHWCASSFCCNDNGETNVARTQPCRWTGAGTHARAPRLRHSEQFQLSTATNHSSYWAWTATATAASNTRELTRLAKHKKAPVLQMIRQSTNSCGHIERFPSLRIAQTVLHTNTHFGTIFDEKYRKNYVRETIEQAATSTKHGRTKLSN